MPAQCQSCGFDNPGDFRWCGRCGARIGPEAGADRRQLTALFCDIVGSTALASRLDPEEMRALLAEFRRRAAGTITREGGSVAQHFGDGLLAFFGWPEPMEGSAVAAVRAALAMQGELAALAGGPAALRVRIGVHTGVGVAESRAGGEEVSGLLVHVAARLQEIAPASGVVISGETERLVRARFLTDHLGTLPLKGFSKPWRAFRVLGEKAARHALESREEPELTPLLGRENALQILDAAWQRVQAGDGVPMLVVGEAGLGKSRLLRAFRTAVAPQAHRWVETAATETGRHTAFEPLVALGRALLGGPAVAAEENRYRNLEASLETLGLVGGEPSALLAALFGLALPAGVAAPTWTPEQLRERGLTLLVEICRRRAAQLPVIFVLEDLHWADASTRAFVQALGAARPAGLFLLVTARPDYAEPWRGERLTLERLGEGDAHKLIVALGGGRPLPEVKMREITRNADGVPLFLEEITRALLESGAVVDCGDHFAASGQQLELTLPATLRDALRARLDRLGPAAGVVRAAAIIGREFSPALLRAVWCGGDAAALEAHLERLVRAGILERRGERYAFHHALVQREAYDGMLLAERRAGHAAVVRALDGEFAALKQEQPEFAAQHLLRAGFPERAVPLLLAAAEAALARHAHLEACGLFRAALAAVRALPADPERLAREVGILLPLLRSLIVVHGYAAPEVHEVCEESRALATQLPGPSSLQIASPLTSFHVARAEYATASAMIERHRAEASAQDPSIQAGWMAMETIIAYYQGRFRAASDCAVRCLDLYEAGNRATLSTNWDSKVVALGWRWQALALLGQPETGARCIAEAIAHSAATCTVDTVGFARHWELTGRMLLHDFAAVAAGAPAVLEFCKEYCLSVPLALTGIIYGCALAHLGQGAEGLALARRYYAGWLATGMRIAATGHQQKIAEACLAAGQEDAAREALAEAQRQLEPGEEHWMRAEILRTEAQLWLRTGDPARAEARLLAAIRVAHNQDACWLELRAATPLARLWQEQGRSEEARALLAPIHAALPEGRDLPEARAAGELLKALA